MSRSHMTSYGMVQKDSDKFESERFRQILFRNIQTIISSERFRLYIRFRKIQTLQKNSATFQNLNLSERCSEMFSLCPVMLQKEFREIQKRILC